MRCGTHTQEKMQNRTLVDDNTVNRRVGTQRFGRCGENTSHVWPTVFLPTVVPAAVGFKGVVTGICVTLT